jgi:hypothetical protein
MSLTETSDVFASVNESALNDVVVAITRARPHLLSYGSPGFTPVSTVDDTQMPAIPFPGTGGIDWHVRASTPVIDLDDEDVPLPPELTFPAGGLSLSLVVEICTACGGKVKGDDKPTDKPDDKPNREPWKPTPGRITDPLCTKLEVYATGRLVATTTTTGEPAVAIALDGIEIVDITPVELENTLECLLASILRAMLADIRLPLTALRAGMFTLTPTQAPTIAADTVSIRGDL